MIVLWMETIQAREGAAVWGPSFTPFPLYHAVKGQDERRAATGDGPPPLTWREPPDLP